MEIGAKTGTAAVNQNPAAASSTVPDVLNFCHTGKDFYLGKFN